MRKGFEERLNTVSQTKSGKPSRQISKESELHETKIVEWV